MSDPALTLELEARLVNAWPAFEIELASGWLLRFAEGYSKRANSATPIAPGATLDRAFLDWASASFEARGLSPCFRLTGVEADGADALLADHGFEPHDPSLCMVAPIDAQMHTVDPAVQIQTVAKAEWISAAAAAYGGDKANAGILGRIVRRIRQPAAFATLTLDGMPAAWGFAVAERGFVGLYDIVVGPDLRGLGLGRRLVTSLMGWGRGQGAGRAYLQVRELNEVASSLYGSLGFEVAYRYTHRILGTAPTSAPVETSP